MTCVIDTDFDGGVGDNDAGPMDTGPVDMGAPDMGPVDMGPPPEDPGLNGGPVSNLSAGDMKGLTMGGRAFMVREEGRTSVRVALTGLTDALQYNVHVHAQACNDEEGGPHYKIDPTIMDTVEANEIWPNVTGRPDGRGAGYANVDHYARAEATSIVVHDPMDNERIACADLGPNYPVDHTGTFAELAAGMGSGITGSVTMERNLRAGTIVTVNLAGTLTPNAEYPIHVHAKSCDDEEGGPHYKIDPTEMMTVEANEIWPNAVANGAGDMASGITDTPHVARAEAWAVVVHDPTTNDRLLCANLW